ncbi:MAG: alpha/beta hydrolase-fold protein [Planctomycetota bacterium]
MTFSGLMLATCLAMAADAPHSVTTIEARLAKKPTGDEAADLVKTLRGMLSKQADLTLGMSSPPKAGRKVLWFIEAPDAQSVKVVGSEGSAWPLQEIDQSEVFAAVVEVPNVFEAKFHYDVDGEKRGGGDLRVEEFPLGPDSQKQPGVPQGKLLEMGEWRSNIYEGTSRSWWVYVPAQYDPREGACVMFFQDGEWYAKGDGNACIVFDNLIHQKKIPPIIGVFVNPGVYPGKGPEKGRSSRSDEYDTCTPRYAEFLEKEILAEVAKQFKLKDDPKCRAICGISSGGSCAFTAAWHRPDLFSRVLSHVGSFCDFRPVGKYPTLDNGNPPKVEDPATWKVAHDYPPLIRKTQPRKPLRVFLQAGSRDLDNTLGNWPLANEQMAAALRYAGYPHRYVRGDGFHSKSHGMSILPESLVWLWSETAE